MVQVFTPSESLRPYVKCYVMVNCELSCVNSMMPDTSLILGFRYKGHTKYQTDVDNELPFAVVAGLRKTLQIMKDDANTGNLLVVFNAAGAASFFKEPLNLTYNEVLPLDEFSNFKSLAKIEDQLCTAISDNERVRIVDQFLLSRLCCYKADPLIDEAICKINQTKGVVKIKALANTMYISIDVFEKR